ncbi:uncharacterized protein BDW47DRAFT_126837 [Aspergillus candidus]|uniref:Uncharacterized protein n=1 Tax=Aspergillus candidus TaxID=41067 RepID=A0A2I2F8H2_ASPCN|nr:hypothetical protein BDW47DRAFT_126837 [Aspergillus candidus]PLB36927.1 hypothetical protein BDW47DRAFT_126837 [Aspergillus candidus]
MKAVLMPRYLTVPRGAASLLASAKGRAPRSTQPVTRLTSRLAINRGFASAPCPSFQPAITTQPGVHSFADITRRSRLGFPLCPPAPAPSTRFFTPLPGPIPAPLLFQRSTRLQQSTRCPSQAAASSVHATRSARAPAAAPAPRPAPRFLVRPSVRDAEPVSRSIPARARAPTRAPTPAPAAVSRSARLLARHPAPPPTPAKATVSHSARPVARHPVPSPTPAKATVSRSARLLARHPVPPPTPVRRSFGCPPVLERMAKRRVAHRQELERLKGLQRLQPSVPSVSITRSPSPTRSPPVAPCPPAVAGSSPKPTPVQSTQVGGEVKPKKRSGPTYSCLKWWCDASHQGKIYVVGIGGRVQHDGPVPDRLVDGLRHRCRRRWKSGGPMHGLFGAFRDRCRWRAC